MKLIYKISLGILSGFFIFDGIFRIIIGNQAKSVTSNIGSMMITNNYISGGYFDLFLGLVFIFSIFYFK